MGNFSRNTFDPAKRYTAVRLQQGVPLVDADWNELQDVTRNELYDALGHVLPNGLQQGSMLLQGIAFNDLQLTNGTAVIGNRPFRLTSALRYSTQRYANAAVAAADGVQVAPPLTTPTGSARSDLVFLDVFEREVGSTEDGTIVNAAIGVETAVRLRREVVLRVAENASATPAPPAGHTFLPVATVLRPPDQPAISASMIEDIAPRPQASPFIDLAVPPLFHPGQGFTEWQHFFGSGTTFFARKNAGAGAFGMIPLNLPHLSRIRSVRARGSTFTGGGTVLFVLRRVRFDNSVSQVIVSDVVNAAGAFDRTLTVSQSSGLSLVDNLTFCYTLEANASTTQDFVEVRGLTVRCIP
jgi:hypothetical protein